MRREFKTCMPNSIRAGSAKFRACRFLLAPFRALPLISLLARYSCELVAAAAAAAAVVVY